MQMACCDLFQVRLTITSVWKVQFQQFKHFSVACSELFHMARLNQKCFSTQKLFKLFAWILIDGTIMENLN